MSQDGNQGYGDNTPPSNQPPYGSPPPAQNTYGPPPTDYGTPQNPYEPAQNPYGAPPLQAFSSLIYATSSGSAFLNIIIVPLTFFIGVGVLFLLAKAFQGEGTFLTHSDPSRLYQVPIYIINSLFSGLFNFSQRRK